MFFCALLFFLVQLAVLTRASMKKGLDDDDLGSSNEKAFAKKNGTAQIHTDSGCICRWSLSQLGNASSDERLA